MELESKNKEELIGIINELQTAYNALKEYYEKDQSLLSEAEARIYKSEEKFCKAFTTSPDAICINRLSDGMYVLINESFTRITGYTEEDITGKTSLDINIWVDPNDRTKLIRELNTNDKVENFEARFRKKDGTIVTGLMSATILEIESEKYILSVTRDISAIRIMEEELEKERTLLRTLVDTLPDRIYIKDTQSRFVICNKALIERMGKTNIEEVIGKSDFDFQPRELAERFYNDEQEIIRSGKPLINHEEPRVLITGEKRWNLTTKVPWKDHKGNIIGIVGIGRDITEIKRRETELKVLYEIIRGASTTSSLEELLKLIHEMLKQVVYAENCFIALYNKDSGLFSFPYFVDEFDNTPTPKDLAKSLTSYVFRTDKPFLFTDERFLELKEKGEVELIGTPSASWIGIPLRNPEGVIGVLVLQNYEQKNVYSQQDIDFLMSIGGQIAFAIERKKAEEEIKLKNIMLQQLNEEKDKFFSIIAHDLRGPLSAFMEATRILSEEIINMSYEEIKELAINMNKEAESIYLLLENLLEWSRLQRGVLKFQKEQINFKELVEKSISPLLLNANKKEIKIKKEIPDELVIEADRHMLETVVRNIVSNAIKFTPVNGSVKISAGLVEKEDVVKVEISDTGIGIPADRIETIFSISSKFNRPGTNGEPSSGLGLLLCKEFVEKHNGKISVESEEDIGTTFRFSLPYK